MRRLLTSTLIAGMIFFLAAPSIAGEGGAALGGEPDSWIPDDETLHYEWDLGGFLGTIATLFIPGKGDGWLTTVATEEGRLRTELHVTSPRSRRGEFWLYGAEIEPSGPLTRQVWSSYRFRGKEKDKASELSDAAVVDVVSGIFMLRKEPPREPRRMKIWSEGKLYPVVIRPTGVARRKVGGESVAVRGFEVQGDPTREGRRWDGRLEIYLADDPASTPVEILMRRDFANLRLLLAERDAGDPLQSARRQREIRAIRGPAVDPEPLD